jgi:hypothetical protein
MNYLINNKILKIEILAQTVFADKDNIIISIDTIKYLDYFIKKNGSYTSFTSDVEFRKLQDYKILYEEADYKFSKGINYFVIEDIIELLNKQQDT